MVVVGSGLMAPGIAAACAGAGATVTIAGRNEERAAEAARVAGVDAGPLEEGVLRAADLVIETISEDRNAKTGLFGRIEPWLSPEAILATNTSSLALDALAEGLRRPERFLGFHFLNPAELTSVGEVIPGSATAPDVVRRVAELGERMSKTPLVLRRDIPGFIWNRIQFAVLRECLQLLGEGVADAASIDAAVADGLAPRWVGAGPLATAQLGGLDTFRTVAGELFPVLASGASVPEELEREFFTWDAGERDRIVALRREAIEAGRRVSDRRAM